MRYSRDKQRQMETTEKKQYITLQHLEVYQLSRQLSRSGWDIYQKLGWQDKKIMGDQFITSVDSVGANIAEGYSRFHYLDKIKFYYNSRGSLSESLDHWLELLRERNKINDEDFERLKDVNRELSIKLNNFINSTYNSKRNERKDQ